MNLERLISSFTEYEKKKILEIIIFSTNIIKDCESPVTKAKDTISDFLKDDSIVLSIRLRNLLKKICSFDKIYPQIVNKNIHDIKKEELIQFRSFGIECWIEFEQAVAIYKPKPFIVKRKILLEDWLQDFQSNGNRAGQMSIRLYNNLLLINKGYLQYDDGIYIHEIEEAECCRRRNFGKKSWQEFVKLRGY
jgi:hypothetical protein